MEPDFGYAHAMLGMTLFANSSVEEGIIEAQKAVQVGRTQASNSGLYIRERCCNYLQFIVISIQQRKTA